MTPLDVISLVSAKNHLVVLNDNFYDFQIGGDGVDKFGLIGVVVSMVEKYTDYALYERYATYYQTTNCDSWVNICTFPIAVTSVTGGVVKARNKALSIDVYCPRDGEIQATVGYSDVSEIPAPLIGACYKLLTYLFENKDAYEATIPYDVQLMLNQWRRSASI